MGKLFGFEKEKKKKILLFGFSAQSVLSGNLKNGSVIVKSIDIFVMS